MFKLPADFSVEERSQRAEKLFRSGYNCTQSVVLAFSDIVGIDEKTLAGLLTGFGGGMGRMREVCGAVSGMTFMAGVMRPFDNPADKNAKHRNYELVQEMAGEFRQSNGSIVCRELLGLGCGADSPVPAERTESYYKKRPCAQLVSLATGIVARHLLEEK